MCKSLFAILLELYLNSNNTLNYLFFFLFGENRQRAHNHQNHFNIHIFFNLNNFLLSKKKCKFVRINILLFWRLLNRSYGCKWNKISRVYCSTIAFFKNRKCKYINGWNKISIFAILLFSLDAQKNLSAFWIVIIFFSLNSVYEAILAKEISNEFPIYLLETEYQVKKFAKFAIVLSETHFIDQNCK